MTGLDLVYVTTRSDLISLTFMNSDLIVRGYHC
jgi:hypothetical protein